MEHIVAIYGHRMQAPTGYYGLLQQNELKEAVWIHADASNTGHVHHHLWIPLVYYVITFSACSFPYSDSVF